MVEALPFARIALAIPVRELFDYAVPDALAQRLEPGCRVRVPFGNSTRVGFCIERAAESRHPEPKLVEDVLDEIPLLDGELLELTQWVADYYLSSVGEVIEAAVPRPVRAAKPKRTMWVRRCEGAEPPSGTGAKRRSEILRALDDGATTVADLRERLGVSKSPIDTLVREGCVELFEAPPPSPPAFEKEPELRPSNPPEPTPEQAAAIRAIGAAIDADEYRTFLLHGVTGSGKTEVYIRSLEACLAAGRSALILLPEIALTPQTVARFEARVGTVSVLHSLLSPTDRLAHYEALRRGERRVAIGARSAVFAPLAGLGLIIVDECHESSYKQENAPRYHARDVAVVRAAKAGVPCVLGSATPTLETLHNTERGRFEKLELPHRVTSQSLATIEVVDRRHEDSGGKPVGVLSPRLLGALGDTLTRGDQAVLFLNRRGFARRVFCHSCGYTIQCPQCDIGLTYHRGDSRTLCHYCGSERPLPPECPECGTPGLRQSVPGTERLEHIIDKHFPGTPLGRLDRDTASSAGRMERILEDFRTGRTRILIGTQMVAKGHDIPGVTLVGILDADIALGQPDFRAAERTFQLLCQVAGRAGRGDRPGLVILQTRQPDHYAIRAAREQDPAQLYAEETQVRRLLRYPPFGHLIRIVFEDAQEHRVRQTAEAIALAMHSVARDRVQILGPAPAPLARLRNRYRYHVLLKSDERGPLRRVAERGMVERPRWSTTRVNVDVDPQSIL